MSMRSSASTIRLGVAAALMAAFVVPTAHAQMGDAPLSADRPGFGTSATTLSGGTAQAELGYDLTTISDVYGDENQSVHNIGLLLLRYGVTDAIEVRANVGSFGLAKEISGLTVSPGDLSAETEYKSGYNGAAVEVKARLTQSATTTLSVFSATTVPLGSGPFEMVDERARQTVLALFDGALGEDITLSINAGPSFYWSAGVQEDRFMTAQFIPTLSFSITEQTGGYVGYAAEYTESANQNFVETGFTYLLNNDTQVDVNGGLQIDDNRDAFFLGLGLAHRF